MDHRIQDDNEVSIPCNNYEFLRLASGLCSQGRFLETKRKGLEIERDLLNRRVESLQEVLLEAAQLLSRSIGGLDDCSAQLLTISDKFANIAPEVSPLAERSVKKNNVHNLFGSRVDQTGPLPTQPPAPEEPVASLQEMSIHMLCQQARYIVVYLERAISIRDGSCLIRLSNDLSRIAETMHSQTVRDLSAEFSKAAISESWNSIKLLQQALADHLDTLLYGTIGGIELPKAG